MHQHAILLRATLLTALLLSPPAVCQLQVSEIMYNPASAEERWEWIELWNQGTAAVDLDGWIVDRVGDPERAVVVPNIQSQPLTDVGAVDNPTVIPAGGVAVLYNGEGLGYDPQRFLDAWPETPRHTPLIGVAGWSSNQLTNRPTASDYAPDGHALAVGFWSDEAAYRADVADFGTALSPNRRVHQTSHATTRLGYDDTPPWPDDRGRASLFYRSGPSHLSIAWGASRLDLVGNSLSETTYLPVPINGPDFGSPGRAPYGQAPSGDLLITEVMYNPASTTSAGVEWEWIEVFNPGVAIDFASTPHWLDDDDGAPLSGPNLTAGRIESGQTAVLYNPDTATLEQLQAAWGRSDEDPIHWIGVEEWPTLTNSGDLIALWDSAFSYTSDHSTEDAAAAEALVSLDYGAAGWPTAPNGDSLYLVNLSSTTDDAQAWETASGSYGDPDAYQAAEVFVPGGVIDSAGLDIGSPGRTYQNRVSPLPGDYNQDGRVDAADYTVWRDGADLPTEYATVGVTDEADLTVWRHHFGLGEPVSARSVPEPSAGFLGLLAAGLGRWRRLVTD